jgi:tetratricopeptide (TPR) repeat protein
MQHLEEEARALREQGEWDKALQLCDGVLLQHPKDPSFTALRREFVLKRRQAVMELNLRLENQLRSESNLEKRLELTGEALKRFPSEQVFKQSHSEANQALDQVRALASKARRTADEGQFEEALGILDTISGISSKYSPLNAERERIRILQDKAGLARRKARRSIGIRTALARKDIEAVRRELQTAFEEFPNDDELVRLQVELTQLENSTAKANELYGVGCHQIAAEEYEAGIATLRQANKLDSKSRHIEVALFNALVRFAKLIVDFEQKRARHLLDEAAQLSPLNLTLESASKYLSNRIFECALADCRLRVQVLCNNGEIHDALKRVAALAEEFQIHDDPLIEELRSEIWTSFRGRSAGEQKAGNIHSPDKPTPRQTVQDSDATDIVAVEPRKSWSSLLQQTQSARTVFENWRIREKVLGFLQAVAKEQQTLRARIAKRRDLKPSAFSRLPKGYKLGIGVVGLLLIAATSLVSTSLRNQPELPSLGTATILSSVTLLQEPSTSSRPSVHLKTGQTVVILTQLPAMAPDAWALIRPNGDKQTSGYVRLQNLDHIKTGDPQFDLWHAMSFLTGSSKIEDLETRLANIDQMLQTEPLSPSHESGEIRLKLAKAFASLAIGRLDNPTIARAALVKAEDHLSRVEGAMRLSNDADELKESFHKAHAALGDPTDEPVSLPPPIRTTDEEARIMRLANKAFNQNTFETAAGYSAQVLRLNGGNLEARKLLHASRQAQKELEAAITGR